MPQPRRARDERGQGALALLGALIAVAIAVVLLQRTLNHGRWINAKASNIARTGRGINTATDAIIQLNRTNEMGRSILATAQPLVPKLNQVIDLAKSIDAKAVSINDSAVTINGTAHAIGNSGSAINATAKGINGEAAQILVVAGSIRQGVAQIDTNVDATIALARQIKTDTGNINGAVGTTRKEGACIDKSLTGASDGHCS